MNLGLVMCLVMLATIFMQKDLEKVTLEFAERSKNRLRMGPPHDNQAMNERVGGSSASGFGFFVAKTTAYETNKLFGFIKTICG